MKSNSDLAQEWLKKAESDFANAELCISNSIALDTACFHCQQAAEKSLKACLNAHDTPFPKEHKLEKLIELCRSIESRFRDVLAEAKALTPYAVERRYEPTFWPSVDEARTALEEARRIYQFVRDHWS
jgi:HEPN domain-containing protein